jgi:GTP cyclohydrolase III
MPTSATGTGRERTPWDATQRAAWGALKKKAESESRQEEREWKKSRTTRA